MNFSVRDENSAGGLTWLWNIQLSFEIKDLAILIVCLIPHSRLTKDLEINFFSGRFLFCFVSCASSKEKVGSERN